MAARPRRRCGSCSSGDRSRSRRPSCPAYTGCERLRGLSGPPSRLWVCRRPRPEGGPGCICTLTPSSDLPAACALVRRDRGGLLDQGGRGRFWVSPATAHRWWQRWREASRARSAVRSPACSTARADRVARRASLPPSCRSGSAPAGGRQAGDRGWSPARPASRTRPCGRCSAARGSRARRDRHGSRPTATSGPVRAISCTWTSPATPASCGPATAVTGDRSQRSAGWMSPRRGSATTTCTRSSTTTPGSPTSSSTPTSGRQTVTSFLERALAFFAEQGITAKRLMTDNAFAYVKNRSLRELLARRGIKPPAHQALPATHQRQGRALPPDDGARVGLRAHLPLTPTAQQACHTGSTTTTARRPHSSLGGRPPISRVHNVRG